MIKRKTRIEDEVNSRMGVLLDVVFLSEKHPLKDVLGKYWEIQKMIKILEIKITQVIYDFMSETRV